MKRRRERERDLSTSLLLGKRHLSDDLFEFLLVNTSVKPSGHVGELISRFLIKHHTVQVNQSTNSRDISKGDGVSDKVSTSKKMLIKDSHGLEHILLSTLVGFLVELHVFEDGVKPNGTSRLNLIGAKVNPLINLGGFKERRTIEVRILTKTSNVSSDSITLKQTSLRGLEDRDLTERVLGEELRSHIVLVEMELGDFDGDTIVLGSDEDLPRAVVWLVGVELL